MKYPNIKIKLFVGLFLFVSGSFVFLFANTPAVHAWATVYGRVMYNGIPLEGVTVEDSYGGDPDRIDPDRIDDGEKDLPGDRGSIDNFNKSVAQSDSSNVLGSQSTRTGSDGTFTFDRVDCGRPGHSIYVAGVGSLPGFVPQGGGFSPGLVSLGEICNNCSYNTGDLNYIPPGPSPTPTPTPTPGTCGSPCTSNNQCDLNCPICTGTNGAAGVCAAPTPTPTLTPIPTVTPLPTSTPTPTLTPTATPTPTPECDCDGLDVQGTFFSGTPVDIKGFAKVKNPDTNPAQVLSTVFTIYRDSAVIGASGEIPGGTPQRTTDSAGIAIDRYTSKWNFILPSPGSYRIVEKINCGWKTANSPAAVTPTTGANSATPTTGANSATPTTTGVSSTPVALGPRNLVVLGTSTTKNNNLFSPFIDWLGSLFSPKTNKSQNISPQSLEPNITLTPTPTPFDPLTAKSIKLTTLSAKLTVQCKEATLDVPL